jgi:hypothetical protein
MNPRELVDHIRSGPTELVLDGTLPRFFRRTRSNPCDFTAFLQAIRSSATIRTAVCSSQLLLGIEEDEWVLLVETLGSINGIANLTLRCKPGSREFHPFRAVAEAVSNAESLCELVVVQESGTFHEDSPGLTAFAAALRERTTLWAFTWYDYGSLREADIPLDPVLRELPACTHLQKISIMTKYASTDATTNLLTTNLLQLPPGACLCLTLPLDHWLAVAGGIRQGICNVKTLGLIMPQVTSSEATEAVKAVASAIQTDHNLEYLLLRMEDGFTDEAGVALAEALVVNQTLGMITLSDAPMFIDSTLHNPVFIDSTLHNPATLGAPAYEAFSAMLRANTSLVLRLPPLETAGADERLVDSWNQMRIEQRLNQVGRGKLVSSSQTTKEEWIDALHELSSNEVDDETPEFNVSCIFGLLLLNPEVC